MATAIDTTYPHTPSDRTNVIRFGVIGYGYWGPNIVRNLGSLPGASVASLCDRSLHALGRASQTYPGLKLSTDPSELIASPLIDAVAIVTPVWTHYELAKAALEHGKHVFVEKPFTSTVAQAEELIELAEKSNLKIMVDHTFLFTGAVRKIRELIDEGMLGSLYYYDSTRVNLGLFQHDINVIWDLAPHDLSIMDYIIKARPEAISATGQRHLNGYEDVAFITVHFPERLIAHINVNWLSPVKVRTTLIGAEKKMLVWNDLDTEQKLKVYDKGVEICTKEDMYELLVTYRSGDIWAPRVEEVEALKIELQSFLEYITHNKPIINDGPAGMRVVKMLEAASTSVSRKGEIVYL
jgi:predicted dehydrogenase